MKVKFLIFFSILFVLISCKTGEVKKTDTVEKVNEKPAKIDVKIDKSEATTDPVINIKEDNVIKIDDRFNFVIDDKLSKDDLDARIKKLFEAIEEKIATGDFEGWYNALSYKNRKYLSDRTILLNMSKESDYLYSRQITLQSPKDYFLHIVMPSRKGYTLKYVNYDYIDKNHIKVNCVLDDTVKFGYDFITEEGYWKVDRK